MTGAGGITRERVKPSGREKGVDEIITNVTVTLDTHSSH